MYRLRSSGGLPEVIYRKLVFVWTDLGLAKQRLMKQCWAPRKVLGRLLHRKSEQFAEEVRSDPWLELR